MKGVSRVITGRMLYGMLGLKCANLMAVEERGMYCVSRLPSTGCLSRSVAGKILGDSVHMERGIALDQAKSTISLRSHS